MTSPKLRVCPECTGELVGHWEVTHPAPEKGSVCWMFHKVAGDGIEVDWPETLKCRMCGKAQTREEIQKHFFKPYHVNVDAGTHDCGCLGIDSSD